MIGGLHEFGASMGRRACAICPSSRARSTDYCILDEFRAAKVVPYFERRWLEARFIVICTTSAPSAKRINWVRTPNPSRLPVHEITTSLGRRASAICPSSRVRSTDYCILHEFGAGKVVPYFERRRLEARFIVICSMSAPSAKGLTGWEIRILYACQQK